MTNQQDLLSQIADEDTELDNLIAVIESDLKLREKEIEKTTLFIGKIVENLKDGPLGKKYKMSECINKRSSGFVDCDVEFEIRPDHNLSIAFAVRRNSRSWTLRRYSRSPIEKDLTIANEQEALKPLYELLRLESKEVTQKFTEGQN